MKADQSTDGPVRSPGTDAMGSGASAEANARFVRDQMPPGGLFAGQHWRISPVPFSLGPALTKELDRLGRVLLQFNRAVNLLYRQSVAGKQPGWIAQWLDQGKPRDLVDLQRSSFLKNALPRVIRPDLLLTEEGIRITELDSVPGGIGLTAFLNQVYSKLGASVLGGPDGMLRGFASIFAPASRAHIVVSEEAGTYRPEMSWLAGQIATPELKVQDARFFGFEQGDAVYRFFELFDLPNVPNAKRIFDLALAEEIHLTPPPKPIFEEKMLFALLWNRNLREFWRQTLGESFLNRLLELVPYTWIIDPTPLPPQGAFPELGLTDWNQLKTLSQRQRDFILKVSGFSPSAWGARGVYLGSDLSGADWSVAVDKAIAAFGDSPSILQRFQRSRIVESAWFDFQRNEMARMPGRVRLCPYYFVSGEGDEARANLGGVLATICPAEKKIIHGMEEAILAPCSE